MSPEIRLPEQYKPLFDRKWRHRVWKGGRSSLKSGSVARFYIIRAQEERATFLCCRENQNSIADSVHALLSDIIEKYGFKDNFTITRDRITCTSTGSYFIFRGLRKESVDSIKSIPNLKYAWVEEAQSVSGESIRKLTPTVREEGAQIDWTLNPETDSDPVQKIIVEPALSGLTSDTFVLHINSDDVESFLSQTIIDEREKARKLDPDVFRHDWLGEPRSATQGAYYGKNMAKVLEEGRISKVAYQAEYPVYTAWDLGIDDSTAIIFFQLVAQELHFLEVYENYGEPLAHYVDYVKNKPYRYDTHFLPHDSRQRELQTGKTREEFFRDVNIYNLRVLSPSPVQSGIDEVRTKLSRCWFDSEKCERLIWSLKSYHQKYNKRLDVPGDGPEHDESSHMADAFRYAILGAGTLSAGGALGGGGSVRTLAPTWVKKQRPAGW